MFSIDYTFMFISTMESSSIHKKVNVGEPKVMNGYIPYGDKLPIKSVMTKNSGAMQISFAASNFIL